MAHETTITIHAKRILQLFHNATDGTCDAWTLAGRANVKARQLILSELSGKKEPQRYCGYTRLREKQCLPWLVPQEIVWLVESLAYAKSAVRLTSFPSRSRPLPWWAGAFTKGTLRWLPDMIWKSSSVTRMNLVQNP